MQEIKEPEPRAEKSLDRPSLPDKAPGKQQTLLAVDHYEFAIQGCDPPIRPSKETLAVDWLILGVPLVHDIPLGGLTFVLLE